MDLKLWTKLWNRYLQYCPTTIGALQAAKDQGYDAIELLTLALKNDEEKCYD